MVTRTDVTGAPVKVSKDSATGAERRRPVEARLDPLPLGEDRGADVQAVKPERSKAA